METFLIFFEYLTNQEDISETKTALDFLIHLPRDAHESCYNYFQENMESTGDAMTFEIVNPKLLLRYGRKIVYSKCQPVIEELTDDDKQLFDDLCRFRQCFASSGLGKDGVDWVMIAVQKTNDTPFQSLIVIKKRFFEKLVAASNFLGRKDAVEQKQNLVTIFGKFL